MHSDGIYESDLEADGSVVYLRQTAPSSLTLQPAQADHELRDLVRQGGCMFCVERSQPAQSWSVYRFCRFTPGCWHDNSGQGV